MRTLHARRVLITGAGRGLGRALAWQLARCGMQVIVTDLDPAHCKSLAAELSQHRWPVHSYPLDVASPSEILNVRRQVLDELGPIDVLINNAGVVHGGLLADVPMDRHRRTIEVNVLGLIAVTHAFLPDLIARPEAHLVNIASASAFVPLPFATTYAASKWAVLGFTDSLREELHLQGHRHVAVTAVCPSYIDTGLFAGARPPRFTRMLTADAAASAVISALRRRRKTVLVPRSVGVMLALASRMPRPLFHWACRALRVTTTLAAWKGPH